MSMAPQQAGIEPHHIGFAEALTGQLNKARNEEERNIGVVYDVLAHGQGTDSKCRKFKSITVTATSPGSLSPRILPLRIGVESNHPRHVQIFKRGTDGKGAWEELKPCSSLESLASTLADRLR